MNRDRALFPFTAIVGQEKMKKALILNAINNNLGGILIRGEKGTAKTTAVRSLASLLPDINIVQDCPCICDPYSNNEMCPECIDKFNTGMKLPWTTKKMKVIDLPLGATEDRVIGTLDIEQAIKKGEKIFDPGILASVNRGILYVDEINLLDDHLVDVLLDAAAMGVNYIEREGVSFSHPSRFILIGTMNPEEGDLRPQLLDRFGLSVDVEGIDDPEERVEIMERALEHEHDSASFKNKWKAEEERLRDKIIRGREIVSNVEHEREVYNLIAGISIEMGVDGHRADLYMLKTAKTIAAYHGKTEVIEDDVREAAEFVLNHRMRKKPFQDQNLDKERIEESIEKQKKNRI